MTNLEEIIKDNAQKYYTNASQALSDEVFDALTDELRKENPDSNMLKTGWGYEVNSENKIKHRYGHVGSLKKVRNWNEIVKELNIQDLVISAKLDGMSVVLYYTNGILDLALTRGDGEVGIDITEKVKYLIGNEIKDKTFTGAVRGEIMMNVQQFEEYSKNHPEAKNHRNSAIGLINGDEITEDYKYLTLAVYSVIAFEMKVNKEKQIFSQITDTKFWLADNFKYVAPMYAVALNSVICDDTLKSYRDEWVKTWNIDGIVISENNLWIKPNYEIIQTSVAWKFGEEIKISEVIDIEWTMSKNSCYIPVAVIKPVELAGTTVQRVTAFNAKFVVENGLGAGAVVAVAKRGEIIPTIMEVIKKV